MTASLQGAVRRVSAMELHGLIVSRVELAVFDVRELAVHARDGHLLRSVSLPLSQLELRIAQLVPGKGSSIVVYDGGDEVLARLAIERLTRLGYRDVALLEGGAPAWRNAGYETYTGRHVIGKAFAEHIEHFQKTPSISAVELKARTAAAENMVVLDCRQADEFSAFSLPGAVNAPGVELLHSFYENVRDPHSFVVVNCAGRTRSIIGAQALINAGVPNQVASLRDGTMDWLLNGFELETGRTAKMPSPDPTALGKAKVSQIDLARRFEIASIDLNELLRMREQARLSGRSFFLLDVRRFDEFGAGHFPGSQWAPGGQLVHEPGEWVGVQNSHIVLIDNPDVVRATLTASWFKQVNWAHVCVFGAPAELMSETGPVQRPLPGQLPAVEYVQVSRLKELLENEEVDLLDLDSSAAHGRGHIPGSRFAIRSRLPDDLARLDASKHLVLTSGDGVLAAYAASDLAGMQSRPALVLAGGTNAWRKAGLGLATKIEEPLQPFDDVLPTAYEIADRARGFREFLAWEKNLPSQLQRDETALFADFPAR